MLSNCCTIFDPGQSMQWKLCFLLTPVESSQHLQLCVMQSTARHTGLVLQQTCHTPLTVHDLLLDVLRGTLMPSVRGQARGL